MSLKGYWIVSDKKEMTQDEQFEMYELDDKIDQIRARSFVPTVKVEDFAAGSFLCYEDLGIPIRFIESIEMGSPSRFASNRPPHRESNAWSISGVVYAYPASCPGVEITMSSGSKHHLSCNRWELDILLEALRRAWKTKK